MCRNAIRSGGTFICLLNVSHSLPFWHPSFSLPFPPHVFFLPPPSSHLTPQNPPSLAALVSAARGCLPATFSKNTKRIWRSRYTQQLIFHEGLRLLSRRRRWAEEARRWYNSKVELYRGKKKTVLNTHNQYILLAHKCSVISGKVQSRLMAMPSFTCFTMIIKGKC